MESEFNWDDEERSHKREVEFHGEIKCRPLLLGALVEYEYYLTEAYQIAHKCCKRDDEILCRVLGEASDRLVELYSEMFGLDPDWDGDFDPDITKYSYHIYRDLMKT